MSNTLLTISQITNECLMVLENNLSFTKTVNRQYSSEFAKSGAKIGNVLNVRKPPAYNVGTTPTINLNSTTETSVPVTIDKQWNVGLAFTTQDMTLSMADFSNNILKTAVAELANKIDYDGMQLYKKIYNQVGSPGTTPSSLSTYLSAGTRLDNLAAPYDAERYISMNPIAQQKAVEAGQQLFNPSKDIAEQYREGRIGRFGGFDWAMDQNVAVHTSGTYAANLAANAVTVTNDVTSGSSIVTGGWTAGDQLKEGDVIYFPALYSVNPRSRQTTGELAQFVVTADATADGGGAMTISVSPALTFSGVFQNVTNTAGKLSATTALKAVSASNTVSPQNLAYHRDAFTLATADLELPQGGVNGARKSSKKLGISMRLQPFYDGVNDLDYWRLDVLGGWSVLRPELAVRVAG